MCQETTSRATSNEQKKTTLNKISGQWKRERPDVDASIMSLCGEIWKAGRSIKAAVADNMKRFDLDLAAGDVMLTLRRQGYRQTLSPSELSKEMMRSTSAMTNRLDRLEEKGLVERTQDANDRRGLKISLTQKGFDLVDELVSSHVATEKDALKKLSTLERAQLQKLLQKLNT